MRFSLAGLFVVFVGGFLATSGVITWQGALSAGALGGFKLETASLTHSLPVLAAFGAPVLLLSAYMTMAHLRRRLGWPLLSALLLLIAGAGAALMLRPEIPEMIVRVARV